MLIRTQNYSSSGTEPSSRARKIERRDPVQPVYGPVRLEPDPPG
jgi:hypothetical protein